MDTTVQTPIAEQLSYPDPDDLTLACWDHPTSYAEQITTGRIAAGSNVISICERILEDHKQYGTTPTPDGFWYDEDKAKKALYFFTYLHHVRGFLKGKRYVWQPWHRCILAELYGWKRVFHHASGDYVVPRYNRLFVEVGRKGSKTNLAVGIISHRLLFATDGAEIYGLATSHKQAGYAFGICKEQLEYLVNYIQAARFLHFNNSTFRITNLEKKNFYEVLAPKTKDDKKTNDSYNPSLVLYDEAAAIKDRTTFEDMNSGMGARPDSLQVYITTGKDDLTTFYHEERKAITTHLQEKKFERNERDLAFFYSLDKNDENFVDEDESLWVKPMPHIGHSVSYEFIRNELAASRLLPSRRHTLMVKYFNMSALDESAWMPLSRLQENRLRAGEELPRTGPCIVGIDLGIKHDFSAVTRMWEPQSGMYAWDYRAYIPRDRLLKLPEDVQKLLMQAEREGWLEVTDGDTIDMERITDYLEMTEEEYEPELYCFDPYHMLNLLVIARKREIFIDIFNQEEPDYVCKVRSIKQSFAGLSGPTKALEVAIAKRAAVHIGSDFIDWQFKNILLEWNNYDELCKLGKNRGLPVFIDNFSGLVNAMAGNLALHNTRAEETAEAQQAVSPEDSIDASQEEDHA